MLEFVCLPWSEVCSARVTSLLLLCVCDRENCECVLHFNKQKNRQYGSECKIIHCSAHYSVAVSLVAAPFCEGEENPGLTRGSWVSHRARKGMPRQLLCTRSLFPNNLFVKGEAFFAVGHAHPIHPLLSLSSRCALILEQPSPFWKDALHFWDVPFL